MTSKILWDVECFKSKTELKENLDTVEVEKWTNSQLLLKQEFKSPKMFEQKKFYAKIRLSAIYNNWAVNININDTITKKEIILFK